MFKGGAWLVGAGYLNVIWESAFLPLDSLVSLSSHHHTVFLHHALCHAISATDTASQINLSFLELQIVGIVFLQWES